MDDHFTEALLALRRFIGVPLPATDWRIRAMTRPDGDRIRVRLADTAGQNVLVDLPTSFGRERGSWWYVGALRHTAGGLAAGTVSLAAERQGTAYVDVAELVGSVVSEAAEVTLDDGIDYLIADLAGDPLWHGATPSVAPELYVLAGFDHHAPGVVRVYLDLEGRIIGVDLPLSDDGTLRPVQWWASAKLTALLHPEEPTTLTAHQLHDAHDPLCEAVYDLTDWA
ncbi:hypothetical protein ABT213_18840 [Streptomyces sp. NPDC001674]|uniref:hypothetical protein n=1 Tax=Streptomyces sp. NPDC001674 TaxID=3154394 RepID=UPI003325DD55